MKSSEEGKTPQVQQILSCRKSQRLVVTVLCVPYSGAEGGGDARAGGGGRRDRGQGRGRARAQHAHGTALLTAEQIFCVGTPLYPYKVA